MVLSLVFGGRLRVREKRTMAHEHAKLAEADYFLGRMRIAEAEQDETAFRHELSAFLSAARSVLQYALEDARRNGRQAWYDKAVLADACIALLKDKRDLSIHTRPVPVIEVETVAADTDGRIERESVYWLDWQDTESAVALCDRYLATIRAIVQDGRAQGILPLW